MKKAVYFFCADSAIDPVAGNVFTALSDLCTLHPTDIVIDAQPVLRFADESGNEYFFVRTHRVVCHDYAGYLPDMERHFAEFDFAGLITWHEGHNAPDKILSFHTTGDVDTGCYGNANPRYMHNLLWALEAYRNGPELEAFSITTEGTHWSGIIYGGGSPDLIIQFPVPLVDIEIGSTAPSWANSAAAKTIARSLLHVFKDTNMKLKNILCVGGVHFEPSFAQAVLQTWDGFAFGISHIIPNHWLVSGQYENEDGLNKLEKCIESIQGSIAGIVFHDNLKGCYKQQLRILGEKLKIPVVKHKLLSRPSEIPWTD